MLKVLFLVCAGFGCVVLLCLLAGAAAGAGLTLYLVQTGEIEIPRIQD